MARILVVEDDPALSRGIVALLKAGGYAASQGRRGCALSHRDRALQPDYPGYRLTGHIEGSKSSNACAREDARFLFWC